MNRAASAVERIPGRLRGPLLLGVAFLVFQLVLPKTTPMGIVLLGLTFGALNALLAVGLVLVYRSNRVINFAHGELGGVAATLVSLLVTANGWNYFVAVPIGLAVAVATGALIERLVIRRFERAPRLLLTVATIGIAQVLGFAALILPSLFSDDYLVTDFRTPLSDFTFKVAPRTFDGNHLLVFVVTVAVVVGLDRFLTRSRYGIGIRAAAENNDRALLCGIPTRKLQTVVWMAAGGLSGVAALLQTSITGPAIGTQLGPGLLLRGLAAAVIGRMENVKTTIIAAFVLSVFELGIFWAYGDTTLVDFMLLIVILAALALQRRSGGRISEGEASSWSAAAEVRPVPGELRHLPAWRLVRAVAAGVLAVAVLVVPLFLGEARLNLLSLITIWAIIGASLVALTGWAGQISLGQFGFVGIGAAITATMVAERGNDGVLALVGATFVGMAVAVVLGIPALRVRGLMLAVTTLAFGLATPNYLLRQDWLLVEGTISRPDLFGLFDLESEWAFYYFCLAVLAAVGVVLRNLRRHRIGRGIVAVRDNDRAAQVYGLNTTLFKLSAFAISGGVAGLAGGLLVMHQHTLEPGLFEVNNSLQAFAMVVIGGLGSLPGAVIGAVYVKGAQYLLPQPWSLLATGIGLVGLLIVLPEGLGSVAYRIRDRILRRIADANEIVVPSLVADVKVDDTGAPAVNAHTAGRSTDDTTVLADGPGPLLSVQGVDLKYGQVQILFDVDIDVHEGEIVALLGTNGAGKSTVLKAIANIAPTAAGRIVFDGEDITGVPPEQIMTRGLIYMPGGRAVFPTLTVADNLRAAAWSRDEGPELEAEMEDCLRRFPRLRERFGQPAGNLSGGEQQMLGLSMAFLGRPRLLVIDELSLGLAPAIVGELLEIVREIHANGTTVVVVEQSITVALTLAQRAIFMEKGEVRFEGPTADLLDRPDLLRSVFLAESSAGDRDAVRTVDPSLPPFADRPVVLRTDSLVKRYGGIVATNGVSLEVHDGEIVGLIGANGAGKTTLFDLISGFVAVDEGAVWLEGADVTALTADARGRLRLGRSFQDARLFPTMTVRETIAIAHDRHLVFRDLVSSAIAMPDLVAEERLVDGRVEFLLDLLGLRAFADKFVGELSTGSRRIVDIACAVAHDPVVLLLDEPSSGIAQKETEALGPLLLAIQESIGCAIVLIEHDMSLIASVSDRLIALELGAVITEGTPAEVLSHPHVVASYLGTDEASINRSNPGAPAPTRPTPRRRRQTLAAERPTSTEVDR